MKNLALAVSILAISAVSASAADMAPRYAKAPPMTPVYTWTGCYVGGNVGAGWSRASTNDADPTASGAADAGSHTAWDSWAAGRSAAITSSLRIGCSACRACLMEGMCTAVIKGTVHI